jgi:hypothetical protein
MRIGMEMRIASKIATTIAPRPFENNILYPFTTGTIPGSLEIDVKHHRM